MKYHPLTGHIKSLLQSNNLWFQEFEHEPVTTSEDAAKVRTGFSLSQGAKALIVKVNINSIKKFVMLIVPGDRKFDKKKVQLAINSKEIRFATVDEVTEITNGVQIGGVPPFGQLFNLEVIADPQLLVNEKIIFNAGDRRYSIAMNTADFIKIVKPIVKEII